MKSNTQNGLVQTRSPREGKHTNLVFDSALGIGSVKKFATSPLVPTSGAKHLSRRGAIRHRNEQKPTSETLALRCNWIRNEVRGVLKPHFPFVIETGRGDARMAKPFLNFGEISAIQEGTRRR